jgi:hydrogenase maturation factor
MRVGKLDNDQLEKLVLEPLKHFRSEILSRPGIGMDCSVLDLEGDLLVISTDPITAAQGNLGNLVVHVCCNDAAAAGAQPVGILVTLLAPPSVEPGDIKAFAREISDAAAGIGVEIIGGHTEITDAVTRIVAIATVVARAKCEKLVSPSGMKPGDAILMSKWAGLEGSAIIAEDHRDKLKGALSDEELDEARGLLSHISVVADGRIAAANGASAMHDATEGGVLGAVWELCCASGTGAQLTRAAIPVKPVTEKLCKALGIDVLRLISSGCMVMASPDGEKLKAALERAGIKASVIGRATENRAVTLDGEMVAPPEADEIYKL